MKKYQTIVIDPPWTVKNNLKDLRYYRTGKKRKPPKVGALYECQSIQYKYMTN